MVATPASAVLRAYAVAGSTCTPPPYSADRDPDPHTWTFDVETGVTAKASFGIEDTLAESYVDIEWSFEDNTLNVGVFANHHDQDHQLWVNNPASPPAYRTGYASYAALGEVAIWANDLAVAGKWVNVQPIPIDPVPIGPAAADDDNADRPTGCAESTWESPFGMALPGYLGVECVPGGAAFALVGELFYVGGPDGPDGYVLDGTIVRAEVPGVATPVTYAWTDGLVFTNQPRSYGTAAGGVPTNAVHVRTISLDMTADHCFVSKTLPAEHVT